MCILARFLLLCSLLSIFLSVLAAQSAYAKVGPISIRSVYTTDETDNPKIVFRPGDPIQFHVDVDNTTGSTFPIDLRFQAFANDYSPDPALYYYDQTYHVDQMPVGLSRFYTPVTLPGDAKSYFYAARITITPSGCQGTGCENDGDWGERTFTIQLCSPPPQSDSSSPLLSCQPQGKAPNLIVLVHGCCTDANGVDVLRQVGNAIYEKIDKTQWEIVIWDWHEYTPKHDYLTIAAQSIPAATTLILQDVDTAYQNAKRQSAILADAIKLHPIYSRVHLIGHSAGAKLIHEAATAYIYDYSIRQKNPFIHLTFLDAATFGADKDSYGSLPDYPNHYSEHYVDRSPVSTLAPPGSILAPTDACLQHAFNFDITDWAGNPPKDDTFGEFGHQWPHRWYRNSVITTPAYDVGFPLSLESGFNRTAAIDFPPGYQCDVNTCMPRAPAPCW